MRWLHGLLIVLVSIATSFVTANASAEGKLKVGDKAPALSVSGWLNGSGPSSFDPTKVYVVEFWATWCGPCKVSIPHLNELHNELAGKVTIIGVSNEKQEVVKPFVDAKGASMAYLVAVDDSNKTSEAWMKAAGQDGIPCAFIVGRDNRIAYIGHPMDERFEKTLKAVVAGRFDPAAEAKGRPHLEAARRAAKVKNFKDASLHYDNAIAADPKSFAWVAGEKYKMILNDEKNSKAAAAYGQTVLQTFASDPSALGDFAIMILTDQDIKDRDTALAEAAGKAMVAAGNKSDPAMLDRLATIQFNTGKVAEAVDTQMEAWMVASPGDKAAYKLRLDAYRAAMNRKSAEAKVH